jgi:phage protein D
LGGLAEAAAGALGLSTGSGADDPWLQSIVRLTVEAGLAPFADVAEIYLAADSRAPSVAVGDEGSIELGYSDAPPTAVFRGRIETVRYAIQGATRVTATNGAAQLARLRADQGYEQQTAGQIVGDFAGRAGVQMGTIADGVDIPFFAVDGRCGAYQQIADLAQRCGFVAFVAPSGELQFTPPSDGEPAQTFSYGDDILELFVEEGAVSLGAVTVVGEGAAGSQGQEAWNWLLKDPSAVRSSAGDGDPMLRISDAALRNSAAVQGAASALSAAARSLQVRGRLLVPGAPSVTVGGTFEIRGAPRDELNGIFFARRVRHRYEKRSGFTTLISFTKAAAVGAGLGGLLGGLV